MSGKLQVLVCTSAFGAGIDKSDVRFVIHGTAPKSMEDYMQQIGRSGRDGSKSEAILLYSENDIKRILELTTPKDQPNQMESEDILGVLDVQDFLESKGECRKAVLLQHFGEMENACKEGSEICDNCHNKIENRAIDVTRETNAILKELRTDFRYDNV